jgi:hypothetical protein
VWKISQHPRQRLTSLTVHLMTWPRAQAGLVFFFFPVLSLPGLNSLSAHLCSWHTLLKRSPRGTTGMWFTLVSRRTFIRPRVGESALLSIFGALFLEAEEVVLIAVQTRLLPWPIFVWVQVRISDCLVPVMMRPLNRNSLQLTVPLV